MKLAVTEASPSSNAGELGESGWEITRLPRETDQLSNTLLGPAVALSVQLFPSAFGDRPAGDIEAAAELSEALACPWFTGTLEVERLVLVGMEFDQVGQAERSQSTPGSWSAPRRWCPGPSGTGPQNGVTEYWS